MDISRIRMISDGMVSTIAGCGEYGYQDGKAENAMFTNCVAICVSIDGKVYVADRENHCIRVISDGLVSTITSDGIKNVHSPDGICISDNGNLYTTTSSNKNRKMISGLPNSSIAYFRVNQLIESKSLSDMTLTIINQHYQLHTAVVQSLCPLIIKYKSIIEEAKISNESLQTMFDTIYSNNANQIKKQKRDQYQIIDLTHLVELIWLFESFEIKNQSFIPTCISQLESEMYYFMKDENSKSVINQTLNSLFNLIQNLIALSDSKGLDRLMLTETLDFVYEQIKIYLQTQLYSKMRDKCATMSMPGMFTLLGLHTEPRVVDQPEIRAEAIQQYLETENTPVKTQPDFTIMTYDKSYQIKCHKAILYAKWPYFRQMIESGLSESTSGEMIMSDDWNPTRLYDFVKYLYTREVGFNSLEDTQWLLKHAELYGLMQKPKDESHESKLPKLDFKLLIATCRKTVSGVIDPGK